MLYSKESNPSTGTYKWLMQINIINQFSCQNESIEKEKINKFVSHAVKFLQTYGFDGLDLDYEYPAYDGVTTDKAGFTALVQELRQAFNPHGWLLTAAVSASKSTTDNGYDVPEISAALDWIGLMSYDLHGSWENQVDHHATLFGQQGDEKTVDVA